jgi:hypothetical protein
MLQKVYFSRLIRVYIGLVTVSCLFLSFCQSQVEYNCVLTKVDWLAACIALSVVGAVLVVFLRLWRKICTILQLTGSKGR